MRNTILKIGSLAFAAAFMLSSCEEDTVTYNGGDFVMLQNAATTALRALENAGEFTIPVDITYAQSSDITVNYELTSETAVAGVHYNILTPTIVIPAGSTRGEFKIQIVNDDEVNLSRVLKFTITGTSSPSIQAGIADEGSYFKELTVVNDDYDCPTQFNYWLGDLNVNTEGTTSQAYGLGGADCDVLFVEGNLADWDDQSTTYTINFESDGGDGSTGTVTVRQKVASDVEFNGGDLIADVYYEGSGIYDVSTGEITIDFDYVVYQGTSALGSAGSGTTTITLAN